MVRVPNGITTTDHDKVLLDNLSPIAVTVPKGTVVGYGTVPQAVHTPILNKDNKVIRWEVTETKLPPDISPDERKMDPAVVTEANLAYLAGNWSNVCKLDKVSRCLANKKEIDVYPTVYNSSDPVCRAVASRAGSNQVNTGNVKVEEGGATILRSCIPTGNLVIQAAMKKRA
ncbi:hypothetical protein HDE_00164 [Halotydeus destructor]|nr:hypothetical protein HDE_00164 [Halotydeus destructor]